MGREATALIVQKSGPFYLVGTREQALAVDVGAGMTTPVEYTQSLLAYLLTNDPWEVLASHDELPELFRAAVAQFKRHIV